MSLDQTHYDVVLLSTSLPNSILSAALSRAGLSILHLDPHDFYADSWASLSLSELERWSTKPTAGVSHLQLSYPAFSSTEAPPDQQQQQTTQLQSSAAPIPPQLRQLDRHYALSLAPALFPATGPSIDTLIASQVSSYATFRLLEHTAVYTPSAPHSSPVHRGSRSATLSRVPSSKQDIFKTKSLSLVAKRKLMKLLLHLASDTWQNEFLDHPERRTMPFTHYLEQVHSLPPDLVTAVTYGVSLCSHPNEPTIEAVQRARLHLQSVGRYGNSAYLVGQYGGAGELAQGYCRAAAVKGATFILDHPIQSLTRASDQPHATSASWQIKVAGIDQTITADTVVSSDEILHSIGPAPDAPSHIASITPESKQDTVRAILVLESPIDFEAEASDPFASQVQAQAQTTDDHGDDRSSSPPQPERTPPETGLLVLPPRTVGLDARLNQNSIMVLMMGEGTFSCPKGQYVYYIQTTVSSHDATPASDLLRPAVELVLGLASSSSSRSSDSLSSTSIEKPAQPLLQLFYRYAPPPPPALTDRETLFSIPFPPSSTSTMTSLSDEAVEAAQNVYYDILAARLRKRRGGSQESARHRVDEIVQERRKERRRRRDPEEFQGRGGRGEDDGVAEMRRSEMERGKQDSGGKGGEEEGEGEGEGEEVMVSFFGTEEEEDEHREDEGEDPSL